MRTFFHRLFERPGMSAGRVSHEASPQAISIPTGVKVLDVSYAQGVIDWNVLAGRDAVGVWIRAGQGGWNDTQWLANWSGAKGRLPRGSYWYYDSRYEPKAQAARWHNLIQNDLGEMGVLCDYEENYGGTYSNKEYFYQFVTEIQRLAGLPDDKVVVYTGYYFWAGRVGNDARFARYPLHLAWYTSNQAAVNIPLPWTELLYWQWTSSGDGYYYGTQNSRIDMNWFNGTLEEFDQLVGGQPPDNGGDMTPGQAKEALGKTPSVRNKPDASGAKIRSLTPYGTVSFIELVDGLYASADKWLKLAEGEYVNQYVGGVKYFTILSMPVIDPPSPTNDEILIEVEGTAVIKVNGTQVYP